MVLPVTIEENLTFLAKWQKIFDGNSLVYDYPLGRAHYGDFGYVSISKVLAGDIHHVKNLHLVAISAARSYVHSFQTDFPIM